jgi:hypothetical protein
MSVWLLPAGAEMWESGEASMQGVVLAGRDDERVLAAVSCTPLYSFSPDAAQGSAEGASLQRESLTFKTEAHIERVDPGWERVAAQILTASGIAADRATLDIIWASVERFSLSERANAVAQTKGVVPRRTQLTDIMGYSPTDADRMMSELTDDLILDQQYASRDCRWCGARVHPLVRHGRDHRVGREAGEGAEPPVSGAGADHRRLPGADVDAGRWWPSVPSGRST